MSDDPPVMPHVVFRFKENMHGLARLDGTRRLVMAGGNMYVTDEPRRLMQGVMSFVINSTIQDCHVLEKAGITPKRIADGVNLSDESSMIEADMLFFTGMRECGRETIKTALDGRPYSTGVINHITRNFTDRYGVTGRGSFLRRNRAAVTRIISQEIAGCRTIRGIRGVMRQTIPARLAKKYAEKNIMPWLEAEMHAV